MQNPNFFYLALFTISGALFGILFFVLRKSKPQMEENRNQALDLQQAMQAEMQRNLNTFREELARSLQNSSQAMRTEMQNFNQNIGERLRENTNTLQNTQTNVDRRLDNAQKLIADLQNKLGAFEESNKRILDVGQGLKELKDIMQSPKLRGNMGEFFLEDLLRQILPIHTYSVQHAFKSGEVVDAVIRLGEALVPVDSKFPLESFLRLLKVPDDETETKIRERKAFLTAIKKHADSIAKKYILPQENTFDFAFMYIPAENVYYETIIRGDLASGEDSLYSWLLEKRVIPVSPNSLYAYLQVIILGLRGLKIQESAKQILQGLGQLAGDLGRFQEDFNVLGKHLKNANNTFDSAGKRLDKFQDRYARLHGTESSHSPELEISPPPGAN